MSKNEADFTPTCFLVNDYFAILSALFSIECSSSTGAWCANCATRNQKSLDFMRFARNPQCSCGSGKPHECWRKSLCNVENRKEFRFGAGYKQFCLASGC